jgi:pimeloyl-ACP methyl ester carboxylesterase
MPRSEAGAARPDPGPRTIIGLELAARYPDRIRTLVAHEPPRFGPPAQGRKGDEDLHATYRARGVGVAMTEFMAEAGLGEPSPEMLDSIEANRDLHFFLGHYIVGPPGTGYTSPPSRGQPAGSCRPLALIRVESLLTSAVSGWPRYLGPTRRCSRVVTVAL